MARLNPVQLLVPGDAVSVEPGVPSSFQVEVFNASDIVDEYSFDTVGIDPRWVTIEPQKLALFPSSGGTTTVTIQVGSLYAMPAGPRRIGVRAQSTIQTDRSRVEEVPLVVSSTLGTLIELHPANIRGGRAGAGVAVVRNLGNTTVDVVVRGIDPENALEFEVSPEVLTIPPGDEGWAVVEVRGNRPLMGLGNQRPFSIGAYTGDPDVEPPQAAGMFLQSPWIPGLLTRLVGLLVLTALLVVGFVGANQIVEQINQTDEPAAAAEPTPAPPPGKLAELRAESENTAAGASSVLVIGFKLEQALASGGQIAVHLPEGYAYNADGNTELTSIDGFDGGTRLTIAERTATITRGGNGRASDPGAPITFKLTNVRNPAVSGPGPVIRTETKDAQGRTVDAGELPAITHTAGLLARAAVVPDTSASAGVGSAQLSLLLTNDLPGDGVIHVVFPKGYGLANASLAGGAQAVPPAGTPALANGGALKLSLDGQTVIITRDGKGETMRAGTALTLVIENVQNPSVAARTAPFQVQTKTATGLTIDQGEAPGVGISSGVIAPPVVTLGAPGGGQTGAITVLLSLAGELPTGARIKVTFPAGFVLNSGGPTTLAGNAAVGTAGTAAAVAIGQQVTVIRSGDGAPTPGGSQVIVTLTNIQNPPASAVAGAAGTILVELEDATGTPIASGTSAPITIGPAPAAAPAPAPPVTS